MQTSLKQLLIVLTAVLGYGSWAVYSNLVDSSPQTQMIAWRAGCIQGGYAGILTFINIWLLEVIYRRFIIKYSFATSALLTVGIATALQYSVVVPVHAVNETPNILLTLLPGLIIGSAFSFGYLLTLYRSSSTR